MKASDIQVGDTLRLKPARQAAYGRSTPFVSVHEIVPNAHYKTPWIRQGVEFFNPADFSKREAVSADLGWAISK